MDNVDTKESKRMETLGLDTTTVISEMIKPCYFQSLTYIDRIDFSFYLNGRVSAIIDINCLREFRFVYHEIAVVLIILLRKKSVYQTLPMTNTDYEPFVALELQLAFLLRGIRHFESL